MAIEICRLLLSCTLVVSAALLLIASLRAPVRHLFGARAAYWLWLIAPLSIAGALVPVRIVQVQSLTLAMADPVEDYRQFTAALPTHHATVAILLAALWVAGCAASVAWLVFSHRRFVRSLKLQLSSGSFRSSAVAAPLVLAGWRTRLVLPEDFEVRFDDAERQLMLAHERTHLERRDVPVIALACLFSSVFWFHPLVYWALGRMRLDQELACDAQTLANADIKRGDYVKALLRTHLEMQSPSPSFGTAWNAVHPLAARVAQIARPAAGVVRRRAGMMMAMLIGIGTGWAAWAIQTDSASSGPALTVSLSWSVEDLTHHETLTMAHQSFVVIPGNEFELWSEDHRFDTRCRTFYEGKGSALLPEIARSGFVSDHWVLFECHLSAFGHEFSSPKMAIDELTSGPRDPPLRIQAESDVEGSYLRFKINMDATAHTPSDPASS